MACEATHVTTDIVEEKRIIILINGEQYQGFWDQISSVCRNIDMTLSLLFRNYSMHIAIYDKTNVSQPLTIFKFESKNIIFRPFAKCTATNSKTCLKTVFKEILNILNEQTIVIHYAHCALPYSDTDIDQQTITESKIFEEHGWDWNWRSLMSDVIKKGAQFLTFARYNSAFYNAWFKTNDIIIEDYINITESKTYLLELLRISPYKIQQCFQDKHFLTKVIDFISNSIRYNMRNIFDDKFNLQLWHYLRSFESDQRILILQRRIKTFANSFECSRHLKDLYEKSLNQVEIINETIDTVTEKSSSYIYNGTIRFTVPELQLLFNNFSKDNVAKMSVVIKNLTKNNTCSRRNRCVPTNVSDDVFFSFLTHLTTHGYIASRNESAIIAMLCLNNEELVDRATEFLNSIVGTWLNFTTRNGSFLFPEQLNNENVNFFLNYRQFFTEDEKLFLESFNSIVAMKSLMTTTISVETFAKPVLQQIPYHDFTCTQCRILRPVSIQVVGKTICGFCAQGKSHTDTECVISTTCAQCNGIYQICSRTVLKKYMCYFCINKIPSPRVECISCNYEHVVPNGHIGPYKCRACPAKKMLTTTTNMSIQALFEVNFKDVGIIRQLIDGPTMSLLILISQTKKYDFRHQVRQLIEQKDMLFVLSGSTKLSVLNAKVVLQNICSMICDGINTQYDECTICDRKIPSVYSSKICGNDKCDGTVCIGCAYDWLKGVTSGTIVNYANCCCPFCKGKFNRFVVSYLPISHLTIPQCAAEESIRNHMAWCIKCNELKIHSNMECQQDVPAVQLFMCSDCKFGPGKYQDRIVTCSKCKAYACRIVSENGKINPNCNHIKCTSCQYHVCAHADCGLAFLTSDECYQHMKRVHGSWYDDGRQ